MFKLSWGPWVVWDYKARFYFFHLHYIIQMEESHVFGGDADPHSQEIKHLFTFQKEGKNKIYGTR